ncbi:hypothetical protein [Niveibacterium terrae]|uniref:hypothetical protein n=1 Tax=Niveibacterium terrae TaxID=3373598 RepID=UPI003A8E0702
MSRAIVLAACCFSLGACSTGQTYPRGWSLIPDVSVNLAQGSQIALADLVAGAVVLGVAYTVIDPLAPNWSLQETRLSADTVKLELTMKRFHQGGDGEAMQVLRRRAESLVRETKAEGYTITRYEEELESNWVSRRFARGEIHLAGLSTVGGQPQK